MELRVNDDATLVAHRTGDGVTAGTWFVYSPDSGGHYTDGEAEGVTDWRVVALPGAVDKPAEAPAPAPAPAGPPHPKAVPAEA